MSGAETVLLALGPASITGLLGAFVARLQSHASLKRAELETERLRLEQGESRRQQREMVYAEFLALIYRLDALIGGVAALSKDSLDQWFLDFLNVSSQIDLFGAGNARACLPAVIETINSIGHRARSRHTGAFEESFAKEYPLARDQMTRAVNGLIDAMRTDVMSE